MKRLTAYLLVVPLLLSISGFGLNLHLCQNKVQSFGIFVKAKSCSSECEKPVLATNANGYSKKHCCQELGFSFWPQFNSTNDHFNSAELPSMSIVVREIFPLVNISFYDDFSLWKIPQYGVCELENKRILIQSFQI